MEIIRYQQDGGIARITLTRTDKYNAFVKEMALGLQAHLDEAAEDPAVRCIVITGEGKAFCAGQDLQEAIDDNGLDLANIIHDHFNPIVSRIREIEKPIVAAINGVAAGAGANIALACDVVVAKASATFIQAFSKIGLIPDSGGTYHLPRLIGYQKAAALMMLGDKVTAAEAERMGMIYKYFEDDVYEQEVEKLIARLASMPTIGLGLTKRALNLSHGNDLKTQLGIEEHLQAAAGNTADYQEGVNAFIEKRKPNFTGK